EMSSRSALVEETKTGPRGGRMDEEVQLVEQPGVEELADDRHRPAERDPSDRAVLLERGHCVDEVTLELLGVAPRERPGRSRGHDLAHVAQSFGEGGIFAVGALTFWPRPGEAVVGDAPEEHHIDVMCAGDRLAHLLVEV